MKKAVSRLGHIIKERNIENIYVLSNTIIAARAYMENISKLIEIDKKKIHFISEKDLSCGSLTLNCNNSVIVLCGTWYKNKLINKYNKDIFNVINKCYSIPIDEIPCIDKR